MLSNCLVFHTSGGISSSPAASLSLIFLRNESSSSLVNGPSLMSNCLLIILVIGSFVIFGGFPSRFLKCCSHSFTLSCWLAAFNFALAVLFLLLISFIVCQAILDCLSSTESLFYIQNQIDKIIYIYVCMFPACCFRQRTDVAQGLVNGVLNETWTHSCFQSRPCATYVLWRK